MMPIAAWVAASVSRYRSRIHAGRSHRRQAPWWGLSHSRSVSPLRCSSTCCPKRPAPRHRRNIPYRCMETPRDIFRRRASTSRHTPYSPSRTPLPPLLSDRSASLRWPCPVAAMSLSSFVLSWYVSPHTALCAGRPRSWQIFIRYSRFFDLCGPSLPFAGELWITLPPSYPPHAVDRTFT
mgnify:CR=1 FL=1